MLNELEESERLAAMAQRGQIPTLWAEETYNSEEAEEVGAKLSRFSLRPLLYGTDGIDVRAQLWADRLLESINPNATPMEHLTTTVLTLKLTGVAADSSLAGGNNPQIGRRVASVLLKFAGAVIGALLLRAGLALPLMVGGIAYSPRQLFTPLILVMA